ncbi:MAG: hypothetical protein ABL925_09105 [Methylococcales bacterium]
MSKKTTRVSADELSTVAAQSIERALEARKAAGIELSPEEIEQVSGGYQAVFVNGGIINGLLSIKTALAGFNINVLRR